MERRKEETVIPLEAEAMQQGESIYLVGRRVERERERDGEQSRPRPRMERRFLPVLGIC